MMIPIEHIGFKWPSLPSMEINQLFIKKIEIEITTPNKDDINCLLDDTLGMSDMIIDADTNM